MRFRCGHNAFTSLSDLPSLASDFVCHSALFPCVLVIDGVNAEGRFLIVEPNDNDILFGRGFNSHPGNIRFRDKVFNLQSRYKLLTTKAAKYKLSIEFVDTMKSENRRFLNKTSDGSWYIMDDVRARMKVAQALREVRG
jgi:hypothetical protein